MRLQDRLRDALLAGAAQVEASPDLFARVKGSIEDEAHRRAWRKRVGWLSGLAAAAFTLLLVAVTDYQQGGLIMNWWILEALTTGILVVMVILLGPFIKRFGKSYAAEVFRSNPITGKNYIVLLDFAYYLVFGAYVLLTLVFELPEDWGNTVNAAQVKTETMKIAGIFLILGVLHGVNLFTMPVIGRLLTLNRQLDLQLNLAEQRQRETGPGSEVSSRD